MIRLPISKENQFLESIFGNLATVYHRTSYSNLSSSIIGEDFKIGKGTMYGKGTYTTYELESQLSDRMKITYGGLIFKFSVNIENYIIFDYEEFVKSPQFKKLKLKDYSVERNDFVISQLDFLKIDFPVDELKSRIASQKDYSSDIALFCYKKIDRLEDKCEGIVFTGRSDGRVLVAYKTNTLFPIAVSNDEGKNWEKLERNYTYMSDVLSRRLSKFQPFPSNKLIDFGITQFSYDNKGRLIVDQDVNLSDLNLKEIPFTFYKVKGSFDVSKNQLTTLKGCPEIIYGDFDFSYNEIDYYVFPPKIVYGAVVCLGRNNRITKHTILKNTKVHGQVKTLW